MGALLKVLKVLGTSAIKVGAKLGKIAKPAAIALAKASKTGAKFSVKAVTKGLKNIAKNPKVWKALVASIALDASFDFVENKIRALKWADMSDSDIREFLGSLQEVEAGLVQKIIDNEVAKIIDAKIPSELKNSKLNHREWYDPSNVKLSLIDLFRLDVKSVVDWETSHSNFLLPIWSNFNLSDAVIDKIYDAYYKFYTRLSLEAPSDKATVKSDIISIISRTAEIYSRYRTLFRSQNEKQLRTASFSKDHPVMRNLRGTTFQLPVSGYIPEGTFDNPLMSLKFSHSQQQVLDQDSESQYHAANISNHAFTSLQSNVIAGCIGAKSLYEYLDYIFADHFYNADTESNVAAFITFWPSGHSNNNIVETITSAAATNETLINSDPAYNAILSLMGFVQPTWVSTDQRDRSENSFQFKVMTPDLEASMMNSQIQYGASAVEGCYPPSKIAPIRLKDSFFYMADTEYPSPDNWENAQNPLTDKYTLGDFGSSNKFAFGNLILLNQIIYDTIVSPSVAIYKPGEYGEPPTNLGALFIVANRYNWIYNAAPLKFVENATAFEQEVYTGKLKFRLMDPDFTVQLMEDNLLTGMASVKELGDTLSEISTYYGISR